MPISLLEVIYISFFKWGHFKYKKQVDFIHFFRNFIIKYQDRLLYATDLVHSPDDDAEKRIAWLKNEWRSDWKYFSGDETMTSLNVKDPFVGLDLSEDVLRKIYYENALDWYPGIFN